MSSMPALCRIGVAACALVVVCLASPAAGSGDFRRFPDDAPEPAAAAAEAARVEDLKALLREAQQLQKAQQKLAAEAAKPAAPAATPAPGTDPAPAVAAVAAGGDTPPSDDAEASDDDETEAPNGARAGCMYRGRTLIWEKVPGTCKR